MEEAAKAYIPAAIGHNAFNSNLRIEFAEIRH
jgi:hypothetical protein